MMVVMLLPRRDTLMADKPPVVAVGQTQDFTRARDGLTRRRGTRPAFVTVR